MNRTHYFSATVRALGDDVSVEVEADMTHVERAIIIGDGGHYFNRHTLERMGELDRLEDLATDKWAAIRDQRMEADERAYEREIDQRKGEMR